MAGQGWKVSEDRRGVISIQANTLLQSSGTRKEKLLNPRRAVDEGGQDLHAKDIRQGRQRVSLTHPAPKRNALSEPTIENDLPECAVVKGRNPQTKIRAETTN